MPGSVKKTQTRLAEIVAHKRQEVARRQQTAPLENWQGSIRLLGGFPFEAALKAPSPVHLIPEIKPSSPSAGVLQATLDLDGLLTAYNAHASAISVLTDEKYFGGTLARLTEVTRQSPHPILCKDFILEPYQVYEARHAGASAVLLIVKILTDDTLAALYRLILDLGMTPVVEVQNDEELSRALAIGASVLLINNRDLSTFAIDPNTTHRLVKRLRDTISGEALAGKTIISASGIETRADIDALLPSAHCFLIGSSLMRRPIEQLPQTLAELAGAAAGG